MRVVDKGKSERGRGYGGREESRKLFRKKKLTKNKI